MLMSQHPRAFTLRMALLLVHALLLSSSRSNSGNVHATTEPAPVHPHPTLR